MALVWAVGLFALPGSSFAQDDQQLQAYVTLVLADEARDEEAWQRAYTTYEQALEHYRTLADKHPKWQPDIVQYRLRYCTEQMEALRSRMPKPVAPEPTSPVPEKQGEDVKRADILAEKIDALTRENEYLRHRVQRLNDELDRVPPAVAATGDPGEQASLQQTLEEAEARADRVEDEYASHRAEAGAAASNMKVTLTSLRLEKEEAEARADRVEDEYASHRTETGAAASNLQAVVALLRLEKEEVDQVNRDLIRQLEAAADEHSRLSAILTEDGGVASPYTLQESGTRPASDVDDDVDDDPDKAEAEDAAADDLLDAVPP